MEITDLTVDTGVWYPMRRSILLREGGQMSDSLRVPISAASRAQGFSVNASVGEADLRPEGAVALDLTAASIVGILSAAGGEFLFQGSVSADFRHACDRCLAVADRRFEQEVVWTLTQGPSEDLPDDLGEGVDEFEAGNEDADEELLRHFEGDEIDLAPPLWEELVLMAPAKFLCDDECMGLCPQCGANRNSGDCGCVSESESEEKTGHRGFAGLKDLFPGLSGGSSEE